ncbi:MULTISPECIES: DUF3078 domain-containing protein [unclassified Polaribacter]|uniref:DUF3078 domain-containing protein n=1 Tax=unclassified Polaribacter TaxID=196858 RepID=UPI0011BEDB57|nr:MULTISPECIES: DUF3078 domain-containing protein [unclassified Polaribacter]TXD51347.1 DUF3078 domain-containing protein [Polaribacter sp. IC063]TXD61982.1 DUF3078 domain-containing protein [Polaribacter sp. IC066]
MKKLSIILLLICINFSAKAQTADELKKEQAPKKEEIAKLQEEVKALQAKINALPGWRVGAFGTVGASLSGFNNWYARNAPNASAGNIGVTVNGFANLIEENFFWRNSATINLGWVKLDDESITGDEGFETATDVFTISSLYGRKFNKKWAVSGLAEYRTTIIDNYNNPGYLDVGAGLTWTPTSNLVIVMHPGNYNFVFSDGSTIFESSLGAKIVADYTAKYNKLSVKSNISVFQSYQNGDLSNWTFTNSFGYTLWKGIGLGFELGLRDNKQEALNSALTNYDPIATPTEATPTFSNVDNKLQSYWLFGLSYSL